MKTIMIMLVLLCISCPLAFSQYQRNQKIARGEYFINTDPGEGNGTSFTTDSLWEVIANIPGINLPVASRLYVRFKSSNGTWSGPRCILRKEYFSNSGASLVYAEYFINTDPGRGSGTPITIGADSTINLNNHALKRGDKVYFRLKDSFNRWSDARPVRFLFKDMYRAEYYIKYNGGGQTSPATMALNPANDSSSLFTTIPKQISVSNGDMVFVRAQTTERFFSGWDSSVVNIPPPIIVVSSSAINFSPIVLDDSSEQTIHISNQSTSPLLLTSGTTSTSVFRSNIMTPDTLFGYDSIEVRVKFKPNRFGSFSDTLVIESNGGTAKIVLIGSSPFPTISVSETSIRFGDVIRGDTIGHIISVWNNSINPLLITSASKSTAAFTTDFTVPDTIFQNDTIRMTVRFSPQMFDSLFVDTLVITSNGGIKRILLTGSSPYPTLIPSTASIDFHNVHWDSTAHRSVKISNSSINTLMIDSIYTFTRWFHPDIRSGTVSQGDSLSITLAFTPDTLREYIDTLLIRCNSRDQLFRIPVRGIGALTGVSLTESAIPREYDLYQNYPNPFNPSTTIKYALPKSAHVALSIFNTLGQRVAQLVDEQQEAGYHVVTLNASQFASGVYFYRISVGEFTDTKKLILLR